MTAWHAVADAVDQVAAALRAGPDGGDVVADLTARIDELEAEAATATRALNDDADLIAELRARIAELEAGHGDGGPGDDRVVLDAFTEAEWPVGQIDRGGHAHEAPTQTAGRFYTDGSARRYCSTKGTAPTEVAARPGGSGRRLLALLDVAHRSGSGVAGPVIGASATHEQYLQLPEPLAVATLITEAGYVAHRGQQPAHGGQNKLPGGLAIWDGDWAAFPGGNRGGTRNGSFRFTQWNYALPGESDYKPDQAHECVYLYLPGPAPSPNTGGLYVYQRQVNDGRNVEVHTKVPTRLGEIAERRAVMWAGTPGRADGRLDFYVAGQLAASITEIMWAAEPRSSDRWPGQGINLATVACMFGGTDVARHGPRNKAQATWVAIDRYSVLAGEHRP